MSEPKAKHLVVKDFLTLGYTLNSLELASPNRVWCSAIQDPTVWEITEFGYSELIPFVSEDDKIT